MNILETCLPRESEFVVERGQKRQIAETENQIVFLNVGVLTSVDQNGFLAGGVDFAVKVQIFEKVIIHRLSGLDFDRKLNGPKIEQEVDFVSDTVAPIVEIGGLHAIEALLEKFGDDKAFENSRGQV